MDAGQQSQSVKLDVSQRQNRSYRKIALSLALPESDHHWARVGKGWSCRREWSGALPFRPGPVCSAFDDSEWMVGKPEGIA